MSRNGDREGDEEVDSYKLSEIFSIVPEYEGDQIFLGTFLNARDCAYNMANSDQRHLLMIHIKNKLKGRAAQLISSRNPLSYVEIKQLLNLHFGDSRDLSSPIQDLQRIRQTPNESPLTFFNRLQVLNAKMLASIQKSLALTAEQKSAQCNLIDTMALNTLLTGLEPSCLRVKGSFQEAALIIFPSTPIKNTEDGMKRWLRRAKKRRSIGCPLDLFVLSGIIRAGNPKDMLEAHVRIRRELQLTYFENQKSNRSIPPKNMLKRPPSQPLKCLKCGRLGHATNECRSQQQQNYSPNSYQNYQRPTPPQNHNFQQTRSDSFQPTRFNGQAQNQYRPPLNPQQNQSQARPSVIKRNPNFQSNQRRTHYINSENTYFSENENGYFDNQSDGYYTDNNQDPPAYYYSNEEPSNDYLADSADSDYYRDFLSLPSQDNPPGSLSQPENQLSEIQSQIRTLNLDDFNPNANFPEQAFL
ncbi:hypothetical protein NQ317_006483 [Molorchus minor]|uniref:CCHC-type domain-containing protein n=1 Tax=Molorchus minor TaxID=1323400 RepID=A0ABQ9J5A6_9CUCU|nr:hypothetical protein NQ317_006483 [Molorchus minor]